MVRKYPYIGFYRMQPATATHLRSLLFLLFLPEVLKGQPVQPKITRYLIGNCVRIGKDGKPLTDEYGHFIMEEVKDKDGKTVMEKGFYRKKGNPYINNYD